MRLRILTFVCVALLLFILQYQFHLIAFAAPRIVWIQEGFIIASVFVVVMAAVLAMPFKATIEATLTSLSVVLFCALMFFTELTFHKLPWLLVVASMLAAMGLLLPTKLKKASSVLLGLCAFSWLFLTLVYPPITVLYIEYVSSFSEGAWGALRNVGNAFTSEWISAALMLPSVVLYFITRNVNVYRLVRVKSGE